MTSTPGCLLLIACDDGSDWRRRSAAGKRLVEIGSAGRRSARPCPACRTSSGRFFQLRVEQQLVAPPWVTPTFASLHRSAIVRMPLRHRRQCARRLAKTGRRRRSARHWRAGNGPSTPARPWSISPATMAGMIPAWRTCARRLDAVFRAIISSMYDTAPWCAELAGCWARRSSATAAKLPAASSRARRRADMWAGVFRFCTISPRSGGWKCAPTSHRPCLPGDRQVFHAKPLNDKRFFSLRRRAGQTCVRLSWYPRCTPCGKSHRRWPTPAGKVKCPPSVTRLAPP